MRLGLEPGLAAGRRLDPHRAAVHLVHQAAAGQRVQVAADRHVGHPEVPDQLGHPDPAAGADLLQDEHAALAGERLGAVCHRETPFDHFR